MSIVAKNLNLGRMFSNRCAKSYTSNYKDIPRPNPRALEGHRDPVTRSSLSKLENKNSKVASGPISVIYTIQSVCKERYLGALVM